MDIIFGFESGSALANNYGSGSVAAIELLSVSSQKRIKINHGQLALEVLLNFQG
jgi:hypothetical protein